MEVLEIRIRCLYSLQLANRRQCTFSSRGARDELGTTAAGGGPGGLCGSGGQAAHLWEL